MEIIMKKIRLEGSYTIEAALLFPFIMTVIIMLIYISFFLHDRCVMNQSAYQAALRGSRVKTGDNKVMGTIERAARELMDHDLLAAENVTHTVEITGSEISVTYEGVLRIPAGTVFMNISGIDGIKVTGSGSAKRKDPIKFIRECRVIEKRTQRGKDK